MSQTLNDALFNEAFNIISSNKTKSNFLRQTLLQNLSYNDESNSKVIGFLGELEFDLNSLYDIVKDLQLSYHDIHNSLIKTNPFINSPSVDEEIKSFGKTYSITSDKYNDNNNYTKINNYYINSPLNKELNKSMQRSTSCKSCKLNNEGNNYEQNNPIRNRYFYNNRDLSFSKGKSPILNFDYDAYLTDYTLNKTSKHNVGSYFDFLNRNANKYERSPKINNEENYKENFNNENKNIQENNNKYNNIKNNNIFTFSEQKNKNNQELNDDEVININNNNNDYFKQNEQEINNIVEDNIPRTYEYIKKSREDEEIERQKKEIIKSIISEIFQDTSKLNILKNELGDDIGEKLLSGNINEKELYKVVQVLKKIQENNLKRNKSFKKKKFNTPSDKILLQQKLKNKQYNYREFPRGWSSTKDYFVNNGTPLIKDKRYKK